MQVVIQYFEEELLQTSWLRAKQQRVKWNNPIKASNETSELSEMQKLF